MPDAPDLDIVPGRRKETHDETRLDRVRQTAPKDEWLLAVCTGRRVDGWGRFVDNGDVVLVAGIDMSRYGVGRFRGEEIAKAMARYTEYGCDRPRPRPEWALAR